MKNKEPKLSLDIIEYLKDLYPEYYARPTSFCEKEAMYKLGQRSVVLDLERLLKKQHPNLKY